MHQQRAIRKPRSYFKPNPLELVTTRRKAARAFVRLPAWITVAPADSSEHVAFVRDISPRGIFFYSDFAISPGERILLVVQYLNGSNQIRLHFTGKVIRVEQAASKEAVGIAVAFDSVP